MTVYIQEQQQQEQHNKTTGNSSMSSSVREGVDDWCPQEDLALANDERDLARREVVHEMRDTVKLVVT